PVHGAGVLNCGSGHRAVLFASAQGAGVRGTAYQRLDWPVDGRSRKFGGRRFFPCLAQAARTKTRQRDRPLPSSDPSPRHLAEGPGLRENLFQIALFTSAEIPDAAQILRDLGPKAKTAMRELTAALADPNEDVFRFAALALGKIGPDAKEAVPALLQALRDNRPYSETTIRWALGQIDPQGLTKATADQ